MQKILPVTLLLLGSLTACLNANPSGDGAQRREEKFQSSQSDNREVAQAQKDHNPDVKGELMKFDESDFEEDTFEEPRPVATSATTSTTTTSTTTTTTEVPVETSRRRRLRVTSTEQTTEQTAAPETTTAAQTSRPRRRTVTAAPVVETTEVQERTTEQPTTRRARPTVGTTATTTTTTEATTTLSTSTKKVEVPVQAAAKPQVNVATNMMAPSVAGIMNTGSEVKTPVKRDNVTRVNFRDIQSAKTSIKAAGLEDRQLLMESVSKSIKPQNQTNLKSINDDPNAPFLDGTYLSDPWMCRVKKGVVKSPVLMENCQGQLREIVDLRVYKLVGIPTEQCITDAVFLGDRCNSLNGGRARCAQRFVRYGLIAKDPATDKKNHECFRFPTACVCQLLIGGDSPLSVEDVAGRI